MHIEILYFDGCPHHIAAQEAASQALEDLGVESVIVTTNIRTQSDAEAHQFLGSPSVRINGQDIDPAGVTGVGFAMRCRRYITPDGVQGAPTAEMIKAAIQEAQADRG